MPLSQQNQPIAVTTELGPDVLCFWKMTGTEMLGQLYSYELEMISENKEIGSNRLLGRSVTVKVTLPNDGGARFYNGIVTQFEQIGAEDEFTKYRAIVHPRLWMLTRRSDSRIFQQKSARDIIKSVIAESGQTIEDKLVGTYEPLEYTVQYRETSFNFMNRLMEREGIYYYFKHADGNHTMVLADAHGSHETVTGYAEIPYYPPDKLRRRSRDHFDRWTYGDRVESGTVELNDFNFETPTADLMSTAVKGRPEALQSDTKLYDYPGGYFKKAEGDRYSTIRVTERQCQYDLAEGSGDVIGAACGALFTLTLYPIESQNKEYLALSVASQMKSPGYKSRTTGDNNFFECQVKAIPAAEQYRPPRVTPPAFVRGTQTAIVVGPSDFEIYTDKYGRIKVQFHWDRLGQKDANSSCWIRVAQFWAGKNWGAIHIPRIGQEVIVDFLEGDPERPIVIGSVYNADQMPPYTLPDNATQSGIKSRTSKEGTTETFNELRFEDKKDSEEVYFHAQKDFNRFVENNDTTKVGYGKLADDQQGNQTIEIFNNQKMVVGGGAGDASDGSQTIEIFNNQKLVVGSGGSNAADGSQTIEVLKDRTATIKEGNESLEVQTGNRTVTIKKGNDSHVISEGNREVTIDKGNDKLTVTQGDQTITITAGKCTVEAGTSIELKVGGSSIKIEPAKITLKSVEVDIQGDTKVAIKGTMVEVSGDAALNLKGGMIKIN